MRLLFLICLVAWHGEDSSANLFGGFFKWNKSSWWSSGNQSSTVRPTLPTPLPLGNFTPPNRWNGGARGGGTALLPVLPGGGANGGPGPFPLQPASSLDLHPIRPRGGADGGIGRPPPPPTGYVSRDTAREQCIQSLETLPDSVRSDLRNVMSQPGVQAAFEALKAGLENEVIPYVRERAAEFSLPPQTERIVLGKDVLCSGDALEGVRVYAQNLIKIFGNDGPTRN